MEETASAPSRAEESAHTNPIPQTIEELGIPAPLVTDLVLRYIQVHGTVSLMMLRTGLKLPHPIVQTVFHQLRQQQLVDVKRTVGNDYWFSLTEAGARAAVARSAACRYAGPAPVSLEHYSRIVRSQRAGHEFAAELLNAALADLVLPDRIIDQLGTALISQKAIFLYGPTGTGKTSIVERLWQVFDDPIQVPYAVEVDSQIITVFDPKIHHVVAEADEY